MTEHGATAMPAGWRVGYWSLRVAVALLFAAFNLIPIYGLKQWHWDAFQLVILFWSETFILACWMLVRIALVPVNLLGVMKVNGKPVAPSRKMTVTFFGFHAGMFIMVHLLFLLLIFSGDWFSRLHGVGDFLHTFLIASGAWIPLLLITFAGGIEMLTGEFHPHFVDTIARYFRGDSAKSAPHSKDPVGRIVGALYGRIVIMQVAIIFGAMAANSYGSLAPLYIIIGIKTLVDFGNRLLPTGAVEQTNNSGSGGLSITVNDKTWTRG